MKLFNRPDKSPKAASATVEGSRSVSGALSDTSTQIICRQFEFINDFSVLADELSTDAFRQEVRELSEAFDAQRPEERLALLFDRSAPNIADFIRRQKIYLDDRESGLRDIIDLLTKAMAALYADNEDYIDKVVAHGERIDSLTRLSDIREIKAALFREVEHLRETATEKRRSDERQVENLSCQVSELSDELRRAIEASRRDGLTGIYNRKAFDLQIESLAGGDHGMVEPFSLLLLDIDNFKRINDTFGHPIGDRVLVSLVQKCEELIRPGDFLARYGGEEFAIVMSDASLKNATKRAKQICKVIAATCYTIDEIETRPDLTVTVSIGVSTARKGDTAVTVVQRADEALYEAKGQGKNRVVAER